MSDSEIKIELANVFDLLAGASTADEFLIGRDPWRGEKTRERLEMVDPYLAQETIAPLTKPVGNRESIWFNLHFKIMMPLLVRTLRNISEDEVAKTHILTAEQTRELTPYFEDISQHVADFESFRKVMSAAIDNLPEHAADLGPLLQEKLSILPEQDRTRQILQGLIECQPENPNILYASLQAQRDKGANRHYKGIAETLLNAMPDRPEDLPAALQERLQRQIGQQENNANDFWGRLIQTHYAEREGDYGKYGYHPDAKEYQGLTTTQGWEDRTIYARTKAYFLGPEGIPNFPVAVKDPDSGLMPDRLSIAQVSRFVSDFLRKKTVVEMVHPGFDGAAVQAAESMKKVIDILAQESGGKTDYRTITLPKEMARSLLSDETGLLKRMGRMSMAMDAIGNGLSPEMAYGPMDGEKLRRFARAVWPENMREVAWGASNRYKPSMGHHGFSLFRQDMATICYALALNIEDHSEQAQSHTDSLKELAQNLLQADDISSMRQIVHSDHEVLQEAAEKIVGIGRSDNLSANAAKNSLPLLEQGLGIKLDKAQGKAA